MWSFSFLRFFLLAILGFFLDLVRYPSALLYIWLFSENDFRREHKSSEIRKHHTATGNPASQTIRKLPRTTTTRGTKGQRMGTNEKPNNFLGAQCLGPRFLEMVSEQKIGATSTRSGPREWKRSLKGVPLHILLLVSPKADTIFH